VRDLIGVVVVVSAGVTLEPTNTLAQAPTVPQQTQARRGSATLDNNPSDASIAFPEAWLSLRRYKAAAWFRSDAWKQRARRMAQELVLSAHRVQPTTDPRYAEWLIAVARLARGQKNYARAQWLYGRALKTTGRLARGAPPSTPARESGQSIQSAG
jgi:hypothetical protein